MVSGINTAIQIITDVLTRSTNESIIKNVAKIEKLPPRPMTTKYQRILDEYFLVTQDPCITLQQSKKVILPLYDSIKNYNSIIKQCIITKETLPYDVLYYVEFDNGLKFELHQDTVLIVKLSNNKFEPLPLKHIAVGSEILTVSNINCILKTKVSKKSLQSQTHMFNIQGLPNDYYCAVTNCNAPIADHILMRRL